MASKTVKSDSGASIEIVDDADWVAATGGTEKGLRQWNGTKPLIIRYLWQYGVVEEPAGRATGALFKSIESAYGSLDAKFTALTPVLNDYTNAPAFERELRGKRCYRIELVALPQSWHTKLLRDLRDFPPPDSSFAAIPVTNGDSTTIEANGGIIEAPPIVAERDPIEAFVPIEEPASLPLDIEIASQVAMSLLTTVVEIISAGTPETANAKVRQLETELTGVMQKLSARLEDNERLRKQVRELGEELQAIRYERDGLRNRLRNTESNLTAALKGEHAQAVNGEIMRRVDRIMRETPKPKGE